MLLSKEQMESFIKVDEAVLYGHLTGFPKTRMHLCNYCGETSHWHDSISHKKDCPISIMREVRHIFKIPSWLQRVMGLDYYCSKNSE